LWEVDLEADIFAFGIMAYLMLTRHLPFAAGSAGQVVARRLNAETYEVPDPTEFRPDLSRPLIIMLDRCLAHDPVRRYASMEEVLADIE